MKTILTIGFRNYLIPSTVNVSALLKMLSVAVPMESKYHDGNYYYFPEKDRDNTLKVEMVKDQFVIDGKQRLIPEKSSVGEALL